MACYHPLSAFQTFDGAIVFSERGDISRSLQLPCGQCVGCRLERSRQWAIRCMHEASLYKHNCFITLTYNDEHLPSDESLHYDHFQKFMKRLRKRFSGLQESANPEMRDRFPIRFYMCGEYGENFARPHFHACIFNFDFGDKRLWKTSPAGSRIYRSDDLEALWPFGFSSIGEVNFRSAAYVARYILKKVTGSGLDANGKFRELHYATNQIDKSTGELVMRTPEFTKMSLKPGIGFDWFKKFKTDVYPHDYVIVNGKKCKPPKYYDKKLHEDDFDLFEGVVQLQRHVDAVSRLSDNSPERLVVKEKIANARLSKLTRSI